MLTFCFFLFTEFLTLTGIFFLLIFFSDTIQIVTLGGSLLAAIGLGLVTALVYWLASSKSALTELLLLSLTMVIGIRLLPMALPGIEVTFNGWLCLQVLGVAFFCQLLRRASYIGFTRFFPDEARAMEEQAEGLDNIED